MRTPCCDRPLLVIVVLTCVIFFSVWVGQAAMLDHPVMITDRENRYPLSRHLTYLEDKDNKWSIQDVISAPLAEAFRPAQEEIPNFGLTKSGFWIRISLIYSPVYNRAEREWLLEIGYPLLHHVDLYQPNSSGRLEVRRAGAIFPFSHREVSHRNFIFRLKMAPGQPQTIYLHIRSESSVQIPLNLWSPVALAEEVATAQFGFGIYYGIMLVMLLYNLFLFLSIRDITYLYYILYIFGYGFFQFSLGGHGYAYIWPNSPWWAAHSIPFFIGVATFFGVQFTRLFLQTREHVPRLDRALNFIRVWAVLVVFLALVLDYAISIRFATLLAMFAAITIVITGIITYIRGVHAARYFLLAWFTFMCGMIAYALKTFAIIPANFITTYGIQIGSAMEVILLSLGLGDRINTERKEKFSAQQIALRTQERLVETLQEADKLKTEFLMNTEKKVEERTQELQATLKEIETKNTVLQETFKQLQEAKEATESANKRLQELDQLKSTFLSSVSHELRTPLTSVLGFAKLIRKDFLKLFQPLVVGDAKRTRKADKVDEGLSIIIREGERLMRLINDVLDLAKIEAGKIEWRDSAVSLGEVAREAGQAVSGHFLLNPAVRLIIETDENLPSVNADRDRIIQVVINLLNNAAKFTIEGEVVVSVTVVPPGLVRVSVRDTGMGIPPQDLDRVFDQFHQVYTGEVSRERPIGTGLGLTICRQIIEHYNGRIWVESQPGQGSTFSFTLPGDQSVSEKLND
ncbi:MAG: hypothetical protein HQK59_00630 [Deltaproteobacteria bacterium]|nr:hypothetical protein [Deltaproteobacteria bacterium]